MSQMFQVVQAYDGALIRELAADDSNALDAKIGTASAAFRDRKSWLKPHQRISILRRAAGLLETRQEFFAKLIAQEGGKPLTDARIEVIRAIDGFHNAADELRNFAGREIPMGLTAASGGRMAFTTKEPVGVVAAISAFNHPLNLIVHQIVPAIATGCPVIIKPANTTPLCCLEIVALLRESGLEEKWCQTFLTEDNALAEQFATDPRVAFLSFIGSARVGWYLRSKLPPGTRCALEHGGAAPVIIDRSASLDRIIEPIVKGGYYHAGQVCVSIQRIFVHADLKSEFIERLSARVNALHTGDPLLAETEVGPLIRPREVSRVTTWIDEAVAAGARIIGGGSHSDTTLKPSILIDPDSEAKVSKLEIFGPVTCVYGYQEIDKAIEIANSLPLAFQASIFTSDIAPALHAAQYLDAAAVMINDHTAFRTEWMPFAGRHQSGYGTGGIPFTMKDMSHEKMIVFKHDA